MKLILNGRFLNRPVTGVERLAIELTRSMRNLIRQAGAPDITVAVPPSVGAESASIAALGAPRAGAHVVGRGGGHAWEQLHLGRTMPDAWLLSLCNTGPALRSRQALVICDAQFVLHPQSYSRAFRWWYRVLLTILSRRAAAVFTISEFSRAALERHRVVPPGKAHVLRLGVDHLERVESDSATIERLGLAPRGYILAIGSLARHKNLVTLIDAYIAAGLQDVTLVVAGGGNQRVFRDAGLRTAPNIRYLGRVSDAEIKALYEHALAFACPSLSEGFGFTPLEAMAAGCPVIATTGGAVPEVCGDAALYADPNDQIAWQDALRRLSEDSELRAELSRRSLARAGLFRWSDTARQMLMILARKDGDPLQASLSVDEEAGNFTDQQAVRLT